MGGKEMQERELKGQRETFGDDEYVHYIDCKHGFREVSMCQNLLIMNFQQVQFMLIVAL